ncbi:hypothetical protein QBC47DRAFT_387569 [Echria macrotheca]|uniref:Uncharacterized protein n=1 Tax=Echria macrotheca TaxID=438768 RepID=A0AAJ0B7A2_9PEZI|nr:hypothetical protein QBC47DRAFT_387569 [Echria macrotheca]
MRSFSPECTLPSEDGVFVQDPNVRSTMSIVWSSLIIIFLCTWSILHLNVPPQLRPLPPPKSSWESCRRAFFQAWYPFRRKALWMIFVMLVPEYPLGLAIGKYWSARLSTSRILEFQRSEKHESEAEWTLTHSLYADMGGFVLKFEPSPLDMGDVVGQDDTSKGFREFANRHTEGYPHLGPFDWNPHKDHYELARRWSRTFVHFAGASRFLMGDAWTLTSAQLLKARQYGIIAALPDISEAQIRDKSKGDMLVKLLALVQVIWLCIQLAIRAATGRESSQIEIAALAFAVCSFITYSHLVFQPKDIQTPTTIRATRSPDYDEFKIFMAMRPTELVTTPFGIRTYAMSSPMVADFSGSPRLHRKLQLSAGYGFLAGLTVFGAIHLIAWNLHFPTQVELLLWRVSGLGVTALPLMAGSINFVSDAWEDSHGWRKQVSVVADLCVGIIGLVVFPAARVYLLVEAFRSTYYLPPSTYISTWVANIPHIG